MWKFHAGCGAKYLKVQIRWPDNWRFYFRRKANPDPAGALSGQPLRGLFVWCGLMAQYSPELIEQTILVFKSRTGRVISQEEARQAVENISGFFRVLQEWAEAKTNDAAQNIERRNDGQVCDESDEAVEEVGS